MSGVGVISWKKGNSDQGRVEGVASVWGKSNTLWTVPRVPGSVGGIRSTQRIATERADQIVFQPVI